jgi:hypothetical protein
MCVPVVLIIMSYFHMYTGVISNQKEISGTGNNFGNVTLVCCLVGTVSQGDIDLDLQLGQLILVNFGALILYKTGRICCVLIMITFSSKYHMYSSIGFVLVYTV